MTDNDPTRGQIDPGNADPEAFVEALDAGELAGVLDRIDNPDPIVTAGLAGTLYDPEYAGPGQLGELDQEGAADDE